MRFAAPILALLAYSSLAAVEPEPSLDPILSAVGYDLRWQVREDSTLVMAKPSPIFARINESRIVPFGPQGRISALDMWLHGAPFSVLGLACSGGRDLASCGDATLYARRLGWKPGREGLIDRIRTGGANNPRAKVERLLALRLLLSEDPRAIEQPVIKAAIADDAWMMAAAQGLTNTSDPAEDVAQLAVHQDVVFVINPGSHPALPRGCGAGIGSAMLGVIGRAEQRGVDPEFLATIHWEMEGAAVLPIEFAVRYGNLRLDRVIGSVAISPSSPQLSILARGAGLDAVGRCASEYGAIPSPSEPGTWSGKTWSLNTSATTAKITLGIAPDQGWITADQARAWGLDRHTLFWIAARGRALKAAGILQNGPLSTLPIQESDTVVIRWGYDGTKTSLSCSLPEACGNQVQLLLSMGLAMVRQAANAPAKGPTVNPAKMLLWFPISEPAMTTHLGRSTITLTMPGDFCTGRFPLNAAHYEHIVPDWSRRIDSLAQQVSKPIGKP